MSSERSVSKLHGSSNISKSSSSSSRSGVLRRWGLPSLVFLLGTYAVVTRDNRPMKFWMTTRSLIRSPLDGDGRRALSTPYNTTSVAVTLPTWTNNFANVWDPIVPEHQPFFWYIPKAGGTTIVKLFAYCLNLVQASNKGINTNNATLGVWSVGGVTKYPSLPKYVNVNTHTEWWLDTCATKNVVPLRLSDVFLSHLLSYTGTKVFTSSTNKGRMMTMFRHPVKRIVDQFYYRQHATWESTFDAAMASMTLEDFASSDQMVENFVVKALNNIVDDRDVTVDHILIAKEILRTKSLVMIFEWFDVSIVRMEKYFGWWTEKGVMDNYTVNNCHYELVQNGDHVGNHPMVPKSEAIYNTIMVRNWADVELYHYAKNLFAEQSKLLSE